MKTLNETDAFSADITVPEDGDPRNAASVEGAFQKLTNRTRYLNNRLAFAVYRFDGSDVLGGNKFTLTEMENVGGFVLGNNEITVPAVGKYLIELCGMFATDSDTNPVTFGAFVQHGLNYVGSAEGTRFSGNSDHVVGASGMCVVNVTDTTYKICIVSSYAPGVTCAGSLCRLVIRRLL